MARAMWLVVACGLVSAGCGSVQSRIPAEGGPGIGVAMAGVADSAEGFALVTNDADSVRVAVFAPKGEKLVGASLCEGAGWRDPDECPVGTRPQEPEAMLLLVAPIAEPADACGAPWLLQVHATFASGRTGYGETFKGRVAYGLHCAPAEAERGCVLSAGEWIASGASWPVHGMMLGGVAYPETALRELLAEPEGGDASVMVARELVAARLNVAGGAETEAVLDEVMSGADAWLAENGGGKRVPYGVEAAPEGVANPSGWDGAEDLAAVMERFNEGGLGNEVCR